MSRNSSVFQERLDQCIIDEVDLGCYTFGALLDRLPGLYPAELFDSLKRLEWNGKISHRVLRESKARAVVGDTSASYYESIIGHMPTPHPLDFDWRFTPETAYRLREICLDLTAVGDVIVYLGCPTVFRLSTVEKRARRFVFFDKNRAYTHWTRSGQFKRMDLLSESIPILHSNLTLADPPWYRPYEDAFLEAASRVTKLDGIILVTRPAVWTKPDFQKDWDLFLSRSTEQGLRHLRTYPAILRYDSPYFERNSLRAAGMDFVPRNWRLGDLVAFRKVTCTPTIERMTRYHYDEWLEPSHLGFRVRNSGFEQGRRFNDPSLISLIPGDVLPSVSRADPTRWLADVWTEGNRVFACRAPHVLQRILGALEEGKSVRGSVCSMIGRSLKRTEVKLVAHAIQQVVAIINLEKTERNRFEKP